MNQSNLMKGKDRKKTFNECEEFYNKIVILSVIIFALNNWWLKYHYHNWITGKLSDLLFCFFFPMYCSAILSFFTNWTIKARMSFGVLLTLISFFMMKTSSLVSIRVSNFLSIFSQILYGEYSINIVDPSDLLVTPIVVFSMLFILRQNIHES